MIDTERLAPITPPELTGRAALQTRVDRKYLLPLADAELLVRLLPSTTRVLEIAGRRHFGYASIYLDTPDRASYLLTARRRRRRFKVRSRAYLDSGSLWLEVKTRRGRFTVKDRLPCPAGLRHPLDEAALADQHLDGERLRYVAHTLGGAGVAAIDPGHLRPALRTGYRRTTLHLPAQGRTPSDSRVTIDTDLEWTVPDRRLARPHLAIVETKTATTPCGVDRLLWSLGHRPTAISKFATGLAALHPELPHTRWRRVLRDHLLVPDPATVNDTLRSIP